MKFLLPIVLLSFCLVGYGQKSPDSIFNSQYCFDNNYHSLTVTFELKKGIVYVYYIDVSGNGDYINGFDNEEDYAGKFPLKDFNGNDVNVIIKNYRTPDFSYTLNLQVNKKNNWIYWNINQKDPVGYLVKHATLKKCR
jgi:hypothetical protein